MPDLALGGRTRYDRRDVAEHAMNITITSPLEMSTRHGDSRPFTMRATTLTLSWSWRSGEWQLWWAFHGHVWRKSKNDWSPHERGYMHDWNADLPDWVLPIIAANAPTAMPTLGADSSEED